MVSYLVARPSRDVVVSARQAITESWWQNRRMAFDLYISALVEQEISRGDAQAAERRRGAIEGIPLLATTTEAQQLAAALLKRGAVPADSEADALHIAVAATAGVNFLLTWNFKHINNAHSKPLITKVVETYGLVCPILCSPEELGADI